MRIGCWLLVAGCCATLAAETKITFDRNMADRATAQFRFERVPPPATDDEAAKASLMLIAGSLDSNSAALGALVDGAAPTEWDQPDANVFFKANSWGGRVRVDLGRAVSIAQINTYSWHTDSRAAQLYKLYGSDGTEAGIDLAPSNKFDPAAVGWKLIAFVDTRPAEGEIGGQYGVSLTDSTGTLGRYRYLLFDAFETESDDPWGQTFYSEIDVLANQSTVVLVPGMTGSKLCDRTTGRLLWGSAAQMLRPWDGGYRLGAPLSGAEDGVVPCGVIREIRIGHWRKDIYGGLIAFLEKNGHNVLVFDYDWRRGSIESAQRLASVLERTATEKGDDRFALICQSNAAHICRYLAKYGRPASVRIDKIILVGTANGGSIRILRELNRGRQYLRFIGTRFRPETFFTLPALFQDLPVHRADLFVDERGERVDADLFDPATWQQYGWSVFAPRVAERLKQSRRFGTPAERLAYLGRVLGEARRMHDLLQRDTGAALPRYYSMQSSDLPTPARAMLRKSGRHWQTLVHENLPGDRHATKESQEWISREEREALAEPTIYVPGRHFELITTAAARAELLRILR